MRKFWSICGKFIFKDTAFDNINKYFNSELNYSAYPSCEFKENSEWIEF